MTILTFIWPLWPWPSTYLKRCFKWHFSSSRTTTVQNYFWNPCINVQVMAQTSSIYEHFDLYLTPETLTFNLPEKMFQVTLLLLEGNICAKLFWNPCINVQVMLQTSSIHVYDHFDLHLTPVTLTFNLPKKCFKWHFSSQGQQLCQIVWKSMHYCTNYGPDKSGQIHGRTHKTKIVTTMSRLPARGLNNKWVYFSGAHILSQVFCSTVYSLCPVHSC